jgi:hypothetical protein
LVIRCWSLATLKIKGFYLRAILAIAGLLTIALLCLARAESHPRRATTLVVEFVGEMDRPVPPIVISTSPDEGKWYKDHFSPAEFLVYVHLVPTSILSEIMESPLLKRALESGKPVDDKPRTRNNVRFTSGVGHDHLQIMVDAQKSTKILKNIVGIVAKYPTLKRELQEIEDHVRP